MVYVGVGSVEAIDKSKCAELKKAWSDFLTEEKIQ